MRAAGAGAPGAVLADPARALVAWALVGGALVGSALVGCERAERPSPVKCPARFAVDEARQAHIVEKLRGTEEGARTLARWTEPLRICFGPARPSALTEEGVLLLDGAADEARAAARTAHLVAHLADGLPALVAGKGDCAARVERALVAEAAGLGLELRVGRELGAPSLAGGPFEVEAVFWQSPPEAREGALVAYLRAHPDGAPGVDALASGYARRCAAASTSSGAGPDAAP